jgi:transglutaminase-like putative cysteine protease
METSLLPVKGLVLYRATPPVTRNLGPNTRLSPQDGVLGPILYRIWRSHPNTRLSRQDGVLAPILYRIPTALVKLRKS